MLDPDFARDGPRALRECLAKRGGIHVAARSAVDNQDVFEGCGRSKGSVPFFKKFHGMEGKFVPIDSPRVPRIRCCAPLLGLSRPAMPPAILFFF